MTEKFKEFGSKNVEQFLGTINEAVSGEFQQKVSHFVRPINPNYFIVGIEATVLNAASAFVHPILGMAKEFEEAHTPLTLEEIAAVVDQNNEPSLENIDTNTVLNGTRLAMEAGLLEYSHISEDTPFAEIPIRLTSTGRSLEPYIIEPVDDTIPSITHIGFSGVIGAFVGGTAMHAYIGRFDNDYSAFDVIFRDTYASVSGTAVSWLLVLMLGKSYRNGRNAYLAYKNMTNEDCD